MFVIAILKTSTFLDINDYQTMVVIGFVGILLFLNSLRNLAKQEIEIESLKEMKPLILATLGSNVGYLLAASLALMFYDSKAVANNHIWGTGMSLCFIAVALLGLRLAKTKNEIITEKIQKIES
ncbi:MAG: hypothetical protein KAQ64_03625 [Candidatus Pacebacteria bacterium]|nr:hypothetical protein [Candidatus Paceibacterota bacterium]